MSIKSKTLKELKQRKIDIIAEIKTLDSDREAKQSAYENVTKEIDELNEEIIKVKVLVNDEKEELEYLNGEVQSKKTSIGFLEQKIKQKTDDLLKLQEDIKVEIQSNIDNFNLEIKKNIDYFKSLIAKHNDINSKSFTKRLVTVEFDDSEIKEFCSCDLQDATLVEVCDVLDEWIKESFDDKKVEDDVKDKIDKEDNKND